jgi:hypothetical protein
MALVLSFSPIFPLVNSVNYGIKNLLRLQDHGGVAKWPRQWSAKPLFSGSNPLAASKDIKELPTIHR